MDERGGFPSASSISRIMSCLGSWKAEEGLDEIDIGDDWKSEGTELHDYAENDTIPGHLNSEQKWVLAHTKYLKEKFYNDHNLYGEIIKEKRLWAHSPDLTPLFSGKFDEAMIGEHFASIVDYKFGRKLVSPAHINWQMIAYCVLLWLQYPDKELFAAAIIQPRVDTERRFSAASFTPEELENYYDQIVEQIHKSRLPNQERNPCYANCEYCKAITVCDYSWSYFTTINL